MFSPKINHISTKKKILKKNISEEKIMRNVASIIQNKLQAVEIQINKD